MNSQKSTGFLKKLQGGGIPRLARGELLRGGAAALTSFLLGICPLPMSVYPLGIAFFCASSGSAVFAALGLLASSLCTAASPTAYFISALFAVALRILTRLFIDVPVRIEDKPKLTSLLEYIHGNLFCEALSLRVASAAVSAFLLSLFSIVSGGFRYYDLFGAILSISVSVSGVLIFYGAFEGEKSGVGFAKFHASAARIAISAAICLSLGSIGFVGVNLGLAAAFLFTVHFCAAGGLPESCAAALVCGSVCSLETVPILIISAFTAYCVLDVSQVLAAAVACIAGSICGTVLNGASFMTSPFLSLLLGCAVYALIKKLTAAGISTKPEEKGSRHRPFADTESLALTDSIIKDIEKSLSALSEKIPTLSCAKALNTAMSKEKSEESEENPGLSKAIARRLYELGFGRVETSVIGTRQIRIQLRGERLTGSRERLDFIRHRVEQLVNFPLTPPKVEADGRALVMRRDSKLSYHHSVASSSKDEVCGDTTELFFDKRRNRLHALICDGMGSGEAAGRISRKAADLLKALILGGLSPTEADRELCTLLANSAEEEITTTADIFTLDLYDGKASLIKSGSAPSYIIRGSDIVRLSARTVPVGILDSADYEKIEFELKDGDIFLMVSDGVSECEADSIPLLDYLNSHRASSPEDITAEVIELSRRLGREDDLSVIAIKIFPQNY